MCFGADNLVATVSSEAVALNRLNLDRSEEKSACFHSFFLQCLDLTARVTGSSRSEALQIGTIDGMRVTWRFQMTITNALRGYKPYDRELPASASNEMIKLRRENVER